MPPGLSTLRQLRCRLTLIFGEDDQCTGIIGMNSTMPLEINMDERSEMDASSSSTQHGEQVLQEAMGGGTYNVQADGAERLVMGKRAGTLPDGQPLPAWQSWSAYETQVNGDWVYTGTVVEVDAETYYGPWIPLGNGWTYGGSYSPTAGAGANDQYATQYIAAPASQQNWNTWEAAGPSPTPVQAQQQWNTWANAAPASQDWNTWQAAPASQDWNDQGQNWNTWQAASQDWNAYSADPAAASQNWNDAASATPPAPPPASAPVAPSAAPVMASAAPVTPATVPTTPPPVSAPVRTNSIPSIPVTATLATVPTTPPPVTPTPTPTLSTLITSATALTNTVITGTLSGSSGSGSGSTNHSKTSTWKDTITFKALTGAMLTDPPNSKFFSGYLQPGYNPSSTSTSTSSSACASCIKNDQSQDNSSTSNVMPVVPAVVVPLVSLLAIFGLILAYLWRKKRNNQMISRSLAARSSGFGGFLLAMIPGMRKKRKDKYTRVVQPATPTRRRTATSMNQNPYRTPPPNYQSPDEKAALLPGGYTPQYHRSNSTQVYADQSPSHGSPGIMGRMAEGFGNLSPSRWGSPNQGSPRRASGNTVERGMGDQVAPFPQYPPSHRRSASQSNGFGGASASPSGGYVSVNAEDGDGPLVIYNTPPGSAQSGVGPDSQRRGWIEHTPTRPSGLGRYVHNAEYDSSQPPPFGQHQPMSWEGMGDKKTNAEMIQAEGQDVGEISPALYAMNQGYPGSLGGQSPNSAVFDRYDHRSSPSRNGMSPVNFPVALPSALTAPRSPPGNPRRLLYGGHRSPPEYSHYADYSELLSSYDRSSDGGHKSPSRSVISPVSSYPTSETGHGNGGNIMDLLANYGYNPQSANPVLELSGPVGSGGVPPALLEPMPIRAGRPKSRGIEERLLPLGPKSPRGVRSPRVGKRRMTLESGGRRSAMSHVSSEGPETVVSGTGDVADMIRVRQGVSPGRSRSSEARSAYATASDGFSNEPLSPKTTTTEATETQAMFGQRAQATLIHPKSPGIRLPGGWNDLPAPPRPPIFGGTGGPGVQGSPLTQSASEGQFGSGWFKWLTDAGGDTMSRR